MIDSCPGAVSILRNQPAADREGAEADDHAAVDQRQLGGAAADVDMQETCVARFRERHRAGAVGGEPTFELVAGSGADELAGFRGEQLVDGAGIGALDRLAGEDDGAGIDLILRQAGIAIAAPNEFTERRRIDSAVGQKRRQQDRRAPHDLAADHDEAAGQPLRLPLQGDLGEQEMRGRAADIDADGLERNVVLVPDGAHDRGALGRGLDVLVIKIALVHGRRTMTHNKRRVIPGRAQREPGIHTHGACRTRSALFNCQDRGYGFPARAAPGNDEKWPH